MPNVQEVVAAADGVEELGARLRRAETDEQRWAAAALLVMQALECVRAVGLRVGILSAEALARVSDGTPGTVRLVVSVLPTPVRPEGDDDAVG